MSYASNPYSAPTTFNSAAAFAAEGERIAFVRRTYAHLAAAVAALVVLETAIFTVGADYVPAIANLMLGGRFSWLIVIGLFMAVGWIADSWASSDTSTGLQYLGLVLSVVAHGIIFIPLLFFAQNVDNAIPMAALLTLIVFGGLTAIVFFTRSDFSGLGKYLWWGGLLAMGTIVGAIIFQFTLGVWFSAAAIALISGYVLYYTSRILHHYRTDQHVAASLALFTSVALLFWYILQFVLAFSGRD